jgi:hypothetical protein
VSVLGHTRRRLFFLLFAFILLPTLLFLVVRRGGFSGGLCLLPGCHFQFARHGFLGLRASQRRGGKTKTGDKRASSSAGTRRFHQHHYRHIIRMKCGTGSARNRRAVAARMEPRGRLRRRWANREVEWSFWESDIEGKAAMGSGERAGKRTSFKWAGAHESKRGQRMSFNPLASTAARHGPQIARLEFINPTKGNQSGDVCDILA